jgi:hypothetical protein
MRTYWKYLGKQLGLFPVIALFGGTMNAAAPISVSPSTVSLGVSQSQTFQAMSGNKPATGVNWSISPGIGAISPAGIYTAPASIASVQTVTVTANNGSRSGTAAVTLIPAGVSVTPAAVSLSVGQTQGFSASVTGVSNTGVTWSLSPAVGTLLSGSSGATYTAPASISAAQTVTVMATSVADPSKSAKASVTLNPVVISVNPASALIIPGQTQFLSANVIGTSNTGVNWSMSPAFGTLSTGSTGAVYSPPASVSSTQQVTVTAASAADPTKTATSTITVSPSPVTVTISPSSATLGDGQVQQFNATVMGTTNTAVIWKLSAALGVITSVGLYTAPAPIASAQTVTVVATSVADPTRTASATISLVPDNTPPTVTMTSPVSGSTVSGTVALTASATDNVVVASVQFLVDGVAIASDILAPYSAVWDTTSATNGSHVIRAVARDAAGNSSSQSATVNVLNAASQVVLPVEVVGPDGTTKAVSVNLGAPVSGTRLWMQIHNLKYETEASVQINGGSWIPVNTSTVALQGLAAAYGGIGGGFSTLKLTLPIPDGLLVSGANTLTFRFNGTDGVSSGFRVLKFNFLAPDGTQLVAASNFVQDDPNYWQAPSTLATDILAGQLLWNTANLTGPVPGGQPVAIQAKCGMCHAQDGRDLKYFNYSNASIAARAMFHGLSSTQANQIVDYIRSLNVPNPGRPWNPPYQPGQGLDSRPVSQWAAGAGIDAVLDSDAETLSYIMPNGSTTNWAPAAYLNARETPVSVQFPDWNRWLPTVHPVDAWGSAFTSDILYRGYLGIRTALIPNDPVSYAAVTLNAVTGSPNVRLWQLYDANFLTNVILPQADWTNPAFVAQAYSTRLWSLVKNWEINQEFGLEAMATVPFGSNAPSARAWYTSIPFFASPFMTRIPRPSVGFANGTTVAHIYFSYIWYHVQLVLNDGNGLASGTWPIDWPYASGYPASDLTWDNVNSVPRTGTAGLLALWLVKAQQNVANWYIDPKRLIDFPTQVSTWSLVSSSQKTAVMNGFIDAYLQKWTGYSPTQLFAATGASPVVDLTQSSPATDLAYALPELKYAGANPTLLNQMVGWLGTIWPGYSWSNDLNEGCYVYNLGQVICQ